MERREREGIESATSPSKETGRTSLEIFLESLNGRAGQNPPLPVLLGQVRNEVKTALDELTTITTHDDNLEKQYKETVEENSKLEERLDKARREIRHLKGRLSVLEMTKTEIREEKARTRYSREKQSEYEFDLQEKRNKEQYLQFPLITQRERAQTVNSKGEYLKYSSESKDSSRRRHQTYPMLVPAKKSSTDNILPPPLAGCSCSSCSGVQTLGAANLDNSHILAKSGQMVLVGDRVVVSGNQAGTVRYIGKLGGISHHNTYFGIELDAPIGENDGSYRGQRYFSSLPKHGIFIKGHDILCVTERRYKPALMPARKLRRLPITPQAKSVF